MDHTGHSPDMIMTTDWTNKIKNWPETTPTSPSGFHLTHSKILITPHDLNENYPRQMDVEEKRQYLIQWQVNLLSLAINQSYSFQ